MKPDSREVPAPESYATFWEPVPTDAPAVPVPPAPKSPADARDAYLEFVNVTEDVPGAPRAERS